MLSHDCSQNMAIESQRTLQLRPRGRLVTLRLQGAIFINLQHSIGNIPATKCSSVHQRTHTAQPAHPGLSHRSASGMANSLETALGYYSKLLSAQEQRWTTYEKECYAIIVSFNHFDYLTIQHNPLMHEYLRAHKKARLIPKPRRSTAAGDGA